MFKNPLLFFWFYKQEAKAEKLNNLPKITHWITMELERYPQQSDHHCQGNRLFFPKLGNKRETKCIELLLHDKYVLLS